MQVKEYDVIIEGMDCANCALTVRKVLEKNGAKNISINPLTGKAKFLSNLSEIELTKEIANAGYQFQNNVSPQRKSKIFLLTPVQKFLICLPFTLLLVLHMFPFAPKFLHQSFIQFLLCLPVFIIGTIHFGSSAWRSLRQKTTNMDVLIVLGATISFIYSVLAGWILGYKEAIFFETTASIYTLVFLGNWLEHKALEYTKKHLEPLLKSQKITAHLVAFDDQYKEQIFDVDSSVLKEGDIIALNLGEQIPADCKILSGNCLVNESIITGESLPLKKIEKDFLIGGSIVAEGNCKAIVTATGKKTVMASIVKMMEDAQMQKPKLQKLADKISEWFIPLIIALAFFTFLINYFLLHLTVTQAIMRAVAVLVIACPCAMGLATPAAISVGLGRAAKLGILFKNSDAIGFLSKIKQVVFDKTGTLTTGNFELLNLQTTNDGDEIKKIIASLEKFSTHPIGISLYKLLKNYAIIPMFNVIEHKGKGISGYDKQNNFYEIKKHNSSQFDIEVLKNNNVIALCTIGDAIRAESLSVVNELKSKGLVVKMLTGDKTMNATKIAQQLNIDFVDSDNTPEQKLQKIEQWNNEMPTAMVGDGVNDAPALAKATVGISLATGSQLALLSADVVLVNDHIKHLPKAINLAKKITSTVYSNLFWAFAYNIIAVPLAMFGYLPAALAAFIMGFSDVVLLINSLALNYKKI